MSAESIEEQLVQCRIVAKRQGWAEVDAWPSLPKIALATLDDGEGMS